MVHFYPVSSTHPSTITTRIPRGATALLAEPASLFSMFGPGYDFNDHSTSAARLFITQNYFSLYVLFMTDHDAITFSTNRNESLYVHGQNGRFTHGIHDWTVSTKEA